MSQIIDSNAVEFTIIGEPGSKGRPRFTTQNGFVKAITPEKTVNYETLVKLEYQMQCCGKFFPDNAAIGIRVDAYMPIPKSTSKKRRALMLDRLILPGKKPDFDNLVKVVSDALNKVAFHDDKQIVDARIVKTYDENPRVVVRIWYVGENG